MGLFKLRKNKKFNYTPRHYEGDGEGSPFEIKHRFDDQRKTVGSSGLKTTFNNAMEDLNESDPAVNRRVLIIAGILILVFLFIIDFDLSIFFR